MEARVRLGVKPRHATHPLRTRARRNPVNYEALYVSSSHRGSGRDSIGYEILREQAYAAQHRGYVIVSSSDSEEA